MAIITAGNAAVKNSHWYTRQGEAAHRQPKVDGKGDRATTIRDAKALGLIPSVTSISSLLDKPALIDWKIKQVLLAADASPRDGAESVEFWIKRIKDAAFEQVNKAAELGTQIHAALEAALSGREWDKEMRAYVEPVQEWIAEKGLKITSCEQRVVDLIEGFAGTSDVTFQYGRAGVGILDFKTKKTKPGEKVDTYPEHKTQLSAYAAGYWGYDKVGDAICANVFISTTEPGRVDIVKHTEVAEYWEAFRHLCALWRTINGYDPRAGVPGFKPKAETGEA